ncbi:helix-turn-helix domain-containing protein [Lactobacillus taiwanensis]|uniref:helix-turn-helix domain-containing protein n=1 Tax=Lactobacillus taiwanensis TaxID=508451 RepID=UPI0027295DDB|nr:helix-turn-helix domain-containing protein [Lactobacillus taiwanensis]
MGNYLFISDAAKEVKVESHVLRYWEEELHLPIKRNELGHRYYTEEDVERFKQIKGMKERGLQLKAIKMILKDGKLDVLPSAPMEDTEDMEMGSTFTAKDVKKINGKKIVKVSSDKWLNTKDVVKD